MRPCVLIKVCPRPGTARGKEEVRGRRSGTEARVAEPAAPVTTLYSLLRSGLFSGPPGSWVRRPGGGRRDRRGGQSSLRPERWPAGAGARSGFARRGDTGPSGDSAGRKAPRGPEDPAARHSPRPGKPRPKRGAPPPGAGPAPARKPPARAGALGPQPRRPGPQPPRGHGAVAAAALHAAAGPRGRALRVLLRGGGACGRGTRWLQPLEDRASLTLSGGPSALEFGLSKVPGPEAASRLQALTLGLAERVCSLERQLAAAVEQTAASPRKSSRQVGPQLFLPDLDPQRGGPGPGVKRRCPGESLINPGFKRCPPTPPPSCTQGPALDPTHCSTSSKCHPLFSPSKKPAGGVDFDDP
ncbi:protein PAXX isoform X2 [Hippopotamus amphibius kiboko]|uniref:protein PAXX isoform X2 n=1 Tax=Hippopotamus amphibius kiboko TaxID=575201 RepID=UPI0025962457|nr:protein PAXX isoform X2 [Hippopotamus amphibius kiboko]